MSVKLVHHIGMADLVRLHQMPTMRAFDHDRFPGGKRRYREAAAAGAAHPDPRVRIWPAWLRCAGQNVCRYIVVQWLEDLVAFVTGHADPLAGIARKRH